MPAHYNKHGIQFYYPDNWTLDDGEVTESQCSVSVYSPEGAFWTVVLHPPVVEPDDLASTALAALKQEYAESETESVNETISGQALSGYDVSFYYVDLVNTALIRGFRNDRASGLILCQAEDRDFKRLEAVFAAITTSFLNSYRDAARA